MHPIRFLIGLTLCGCLLGARAYGQYLFLDINGDGLHTEADVLGPDASTTFDVWLRTDTNRDGSPASCKTGDGDMTINSYEFILHSAGGEVSWGTPVNRMTAFSVSFGAASDADDFYMGCGGPEILPPGSYLLATLEVTTLSGTPSLAFVPSTPLSGAYLTSFGSQCSGYDQDNTMKLGGEWTDADGTFGAPTNREPALAPLYDMVLSEGNTALQNLTASDPDGDPLTFHKVSGPAFMTVTTTGPATGSIYLAPVFEDIGTHTASVGASDQDFRDVESLQITVSGTTRPRMVQPADMSVLKNGHAEQELTATDPDGDSIIFSKAVGPGFMEVGTTGPSTGFIRLSPYSWTTSGLYHASVRASDALGSDEKSLEITVLSAQAINVAPRFGISGSGPFPANMLVSADRNTEQTIWASDPEVPFSSPPDPPDFMSFLKGAGPDFMTVTTTDAGPGVATGNIRLSPTAADVGLHQGSVIVTDGALQAAASFTIDVRPVGFPYILPVGQPCATPGVLTTIQVAAIDSESDPLSFTQEGLPSYGVFTDLGNGVATIGLTPPAAEPSGMIFVAVVVSDGTFQDAEIVAICIGRDLGGTDTVGGSGGWGGGNRSPVAEAGGPYSGVIGAPVPFDGARSSDPEGTPLRLIWDFGDGSTAVGASASHVYARATLYRATLVVSDGLLLARDQTTVTIAEAYPSRAFAPKGHTTIRPHTGKRSYCFSVEPVSGSYDSQEVDPGSIVLEIPGAGSVPLVPAKATLLEDRDENGVAEIQACVAGDDLQTLLGATTETATLPVTIEGGVSTGGRFRAPLVLTVIGQSSSMSASLWPQPLQREGTLRFTTAGAGPVRVRIYDVHGRLARTVMDEPSAPAGNHDVRIRSEEREGLAKGVYWYRIEAGGEVSAGRFVVLR